MPKQPTDKQEEKLPSLVPVAPAEITSQLDTLIALQQKYPNKKRFKKDHQYNKTIQPLTHSVVKINENLYEFEGRGLGAGNFGWVGIGYLYKKTDSGFQFLGTRALKQINGGSGLEGKVIKDYHGSYGSVSVREILSKVTYLDQPLFGGTDFTIYEINKSLKAKSKKNIKRTGKLLVVIAFLKELQRLHDLGYTHYDLAPENILVDHLGKNNWKVKIIDFGLTEKNRVINLGFIGRYKYMPPEAIGTGLRRGGVKFDNYSAGVIIRQFLFDNTQFSEQDTKAINEICDKLQDKNYSSRITIKKALTQFEDILCQKRNDYVNHRMTGLKDGIKEAINLLNAQSRAELKDNEREILKDITTDLVKQVEVIEEKIRKKISLDDFKETKKAVSEIFNKKEYKVMYQSQGWFFQLMNRITKLLSAWVGNLYEDKKLIKHGFFTSKHCEKMLEVKSVISSNARLVKK